jgi:hypothetical protein
MSAVAGPAFVSVVPGNSAATGAVGRSYLGIMVQPDKARTAAITTASQGQQMPNFFFIMLPT